MALEEVCAGRWAEIQKPVHCRCVLLSSPPPPPVFRPTPSPALSATLDQDEKLSAISPCLHHTPPG